MDNFDLTILRQEITRLRLKQNELGRKMDQLESILVELKIYLKYTPALVEEKLFPFFHDLQSSQLNPSAEANGHTKFFPARKDSWSWKEHILFTLFKEDRPLTTAEIVEIQLLLEVKGKREERYVLKDISKNLTVLVKDSRVVKYKAPGLGKYFYCLPKWMDGKILRQEYLGKGPFL